MPAAKAADALADDLRRRMLEGDLPSGTRLPTERELAEQTGVGRSSVREALRTLEIQGLVRTRPGRGGGTEVVTPTPDELASSVAVFIKGSGLALSAVVQVRETVEPACAALAATHRNAEDLDALAALNRRMRDAAQDDSEGYLDANLEWHLRVALASGNPLFAGFLLAVSAEVREATDADRLHTADVRSVAAHAHDRILDAIREGDAATARRRMDAHVRGYAVLLDAPALGDSTTRRDDPGG